MKYKTRGIVLNYIKYGDSSIIVKIYTEAFGLQTYIINGIRKPRSKWNMAYFQTLTLLHLVVYHKKNGGINRISEVSYLGQSSILPSQVKKIAMALFLSEVLSKSLKEETGNKIQFQFLYSSIKMFYDLESDYESFHLQFLMKFSKYLGFEPHSAQVVISEMDASPTNIVVSKRDLEFIENLRLLPYDNPPKMNNQNRRSVLNVILAFYSLHMGTFGHFKSHQILKEVLN
ncbi:MAG: DNA repair protein RecO [Bacteroidetes bacterium]|nr:DNA repair protein RecO [Bacteroidota bacterium]